MWKWIITLAFLASSGVAVAEAPLLLRSPDMSATHIAFEYGGQLWTVPRAGGEAQVLARGMDMLSGPIFSPDGSRIVFTGTYDHNTDVYVVPATGGQPQRLTWHPGPDVAVGWTPDGKRILFRSHRYSFADPNQLYTVALIGGLPEKLPLPAAETGSYSPDGSHLAYVPGFQWEPFWKNYKGGQHTQVWLADLADSSVVRIPDMNANASHPMWVGDTVYFLSDRDGAITLYAWDVAAGKARKLIDNNGFDITSAAAGPGGIVYSQFGQLHIFDPATGKDRAVPVTVSGDMPQRRPRWLDVSDELRHAGISPTGARAVFEAHGDILSVPADKGSAINLTRSPGAMDRNPAWSPDGQSVAYFSDAAGQYDLYIVNQDGSGEPRRIPLGQDDAFYYAIAWSPDSRKLAFYDQKLNLWLVDLGAAKPAPVKVKTGNYMPLSLRDASWSPDSRWLTFTEVLPNNLHAIELYSLATGKLHRLTDGMSDCRSPVFDASGKYLYFTASTTTGLTGGWLSMSSMQRPVTRHVYAVTLAIDTASPLAPEPGMEEGKNTPDDKTDDKAGDDVPEVRVDLAGIRDRIMPLPLEAANYARLYAAGPGILYLTRQPVVQMHPGPARLDVLKFDLDKRDSETVLRKLRQFELGADGKAMLYRKGDGWFIAADGKPDDARKLAVDDLKVFTRPHEAWTEMYHEAWRIQRAFFYAPNFHGLDIKAAEKTFAHYLPGIASRSDLTFLFREMLSYMSVGHMFIRGGYEPAMDEVKVGLLGADYAVENGHYRIKRIFDGGAWNPDNYAPLAQPGLDVEVGDYLLAVNGEPIDAEESIYRAFENLAGKTVRLTVNNKPTLTGAHVITVKTIASERGLRQAAWVEHNRELVDRLSDGKLAYLHLPDTYWGGYTAFNRYYFAQVDKQGVIIDERYNHGGLIADYIIQQLQRRPTSLGVTRWGKRKTSVAPPMQIYGPKVMVINQFAGSGGDALPWLFRKADLGTIVGERTWGGLVGIDDYPSLMDGGRVTAPRYAIEDLDGTFPVENHGVAPDIEVWQDPARVRAGHDPQLERAVAVALKQLEANPPKTYQRAPWYDYQPRLPTVPGTE